MKKLHFILFSITFSLTSNFINAQGPPQGVGNGGGIPGGPANNFWNLTGNELETGQFLGSTNQFPLIFQTNGLERLRITPTGNIGIGVTNPNSGNLLDIGGNLQVLGTGMFNSIETSGLGTFNTLDVIGNATINGNLNLNSLNVSGSSTFQNLVVQNQLKVGNSLHVNDLVAYDEVTVSSKKLTIAAADINGEGNYNEEIFVGIGTNDPLTELHIKGWTCADCPLDYDTDDPISTVYLRLED